MCTFGFAILVLLTTRSIIADITHTLMERTPHHVDLQQVTQAWQGVSRAAGAGPAGGCKDWYREV